MKIVALLPVNALTRVKTRLAASLSAYERERLVLWMAGLALEAVRASGGIAETALISPDSAVARWANEQGALALRQTGSGLNAGLEEGRQWALARAADALLVVLPDLPLVTGQDIAEMVSMLSDKAKARTTVLAPDRYDSGTNALLIQPVEVVPFAFGRGSFARHCALSRQAGIEPVVVRNARLAFDIDMRADVERLRRLGIWAPRESHELSASCMVSEGGHL